MADVKVVGKNFISDNSGILGDDGYWTVTTRLVETFLFSDENEITEVVEAKAMDKDFGMAYRTSLGAALMQYRSEVQDKGLSSLVEARLQFGNPNDNGTNNKNTLTQ